MKSTHLLIIFLIVLAEGQTGRGSFLDRFSHRRITPVAPVGGNSCHGFAEIRSEFNGIETVHGKLIKEEREDTPKKSSSLRYKVPGGRSANITIKIQGNCCWKFYQR